MPWAPCSPTNTQKVIRQAYYGGCEVVDEMENVALERVKAPWRRVRQCTAAFRGTGHAVAFGLPSQEPRSWDST